MKPTSNNVIRKVLALGAAAVLATSLLALAACSSSSDEESTGSTEATSTDTTEEDTVITVGATSTPHAEILNDVVADILAEEGYSLEVTEFTDYVQPNTAVDEGELDANYFQHQPYLDEFNEENGTDIVSVVAVHYEPFGIYAGKTASLDELEEGAIVAVPNDTTNEARSLLLLEQEGLITLSDDAGIEATVNDIVENPLNLEFEELEAATVPTVLADVDIACINGNYAQEAGLSVASDALAVEDASGTAAQTYANILAVKSGNENSAKIQALAEALTSEEVATYIEETYDGAVLPVF